MGCLYLQLYSSYCVFNVLKFYVGYNVTENWIWSFYSLETPSKRREGTSYHCHHSFWLFLFRTTILNCEVCALIFDPQPPGHVTVCWSTKDNERPWQCHWHTYTLDTMVTVWILVSWSVHWSIICTGRQDMYVCKHWTTKQKNEDAVYITSAVVFDNTKWTIYH